MNNNSTNSMSDKDDETDQIEVELNKIIITHETWKTLKLENKNTLKILQINSRSVNNKLDEIKYINNSINSADIICISETWLNTHKEQFTKIKNYDAIYASRKNRTGGGAAIFVKNSIVHETELAFCDEINSIINISIVINKSKTNIIAIYRPPYSNSTSIKNFLTKLEEILNNIKGTTIITGDFNFDLINPSETTNDYRDIIESSGFQFIFNDVITRKASKSCLDHVIVNDINLKYKVNILPYDLFDHNLIITEVTNSKWKPKEKKEDKNLTKNAIRINFKKFSENVNKENIFYNTNKSIDENYDLFIEKIKKAKENASEKVKNKKHMLKELKPWFDDEVIRAIEKKQHYNNIKTSSPSTQQEHFNLAQFKYWRNFTTDIKRKKRKEFNEKKFKQTDNNPAKQWKWIKNVMHDWENEKDKCPLLKECSTEEEKSEKINETNEYFCNVGKNLAKNFPENRLKLKTPKVQFSFKLTNPKEIEKIIATSKNSGAESGDEISMRLMKKISTHTSHFIADLINTSLTTSHVPDEFKIAKTTPIFKSSDKSKPENYRPISQLPIIAKCEEKVINTQLLSFLENNKIINKNQYGFRRNSNTDAAIFDITNEIANAIDDGFKVALVLHDQAKAFDTAHHKTLIAKLYNTGVTGKENKWFKNYLSNRQQYIEMDNCKSEKQNIDYGVPQGSSISGTSYIIYNNDMKELKLNGKPFIFADDFANVVKAKTYEKLEENINADLKTFADYLDENKSTLNINKTKYLIFKDAAPPPMNIKFKNHHIERVKTAIYLGLAFDYDMKWKSHINNLRKKLAPIAGIFRKISHDIPPGMKRTIFLAMFQSKLQYGIAAWGCADSSQINTIQRLQNKAIKNLYNLEWRTSTNDIHIENKINKITQLHTKSAATHIFKMT